MFDDFSDDYGEGPYSGYDYSLPEDFNLDIGSLGSNAELGLNFDWGDLSNLVADPNLFAAFAEANPEDAALLEDLMGGVYGFAPVGADNPVDAYERGSGEFLGENIKSGVPEWDKAATDAGLKLTDPNAKTSLPDKLKKLIADATGLGEDTIGELGKYGLLAGIAKLAYDDAEKARKAKLGYIAPGGSAKRAVISPGGSVSYTKAASGGIMSLANGGSVDEYGRTAQDKQKENLYRQLEAMDAWNTAGATREGAEAPWLMDQANRMMAVGVKDDFTESGPGVLLYDPAKGRSEIVNSGNLSLLFERGDPAAAYEQAKNSLPYYQQKALLGIEGPTTQAQERRIVKTMINNPLPALPFIEYGLGQFAPPNYGLNPNVARRRAENEQREIKEKPLEYFKDFLNLSPYQGGLPTIYPFAEGGSVNERPVFIDAGVMNEKGPEDYGIGSLSDQYAFMEANMPAGEASQFDMYGNLIMPDPYFRTLTGSETNQLERDAAREYYKNPENARLSYEIAKNLEDAVIAKGGMGEVDVQETLRSIYNDPELKNMFFNYTGELKYAPMEAADLLDKDYELNKREVEGFTPDNNYVPGLAYELDMVNRNNPRIGHALEREMLKLVDPNAPRTFFRNYEGGGEGGIGGGWAAGGIASLQPKRKQPFYLGGPTDGMADQIPAHIDNQRPAALSDGEFVIPADVVSHLGNGNSNAGAKRLYEMMDSIREARTGNSEQGKQINPNKFLPR